VTEESEGSSAVPGSGAGDAAPTQAIPRIPKPVADKKAASAKSPARKTAGGGSAPAAKKTSPPPPPPSTQTDKGRPRAAAPAAEPETKRPPAKPSRGPSGRPLTAADYAHTTKGSPETTSVIPAVKDTGDDRRAASGPVATEPAPSGAAGRRASLRLTHVEPWSVTRLAFAISVAMMIVAVVAAGIFWVVLDVVGVWDQINDSFTTVLSDDSASFNVTDYFGIGRVLGLTLVLSALNVVLMTALATIAAHLYNLAAQLMGGIEVTLAEEN